MQKLFDCNYTADELCTGLNWMVLQRRDMALYMRLWLLNRSGPDHDPRRVIEDMLNHLRDIQDA